MEAFRKAKLEQFEDLAIAHLNDVFPEEFPAQPGPEQRAEIRDGIARAIGYGLDKETWILRFLRVMVVHGTLFDKRLAWAQEILRDPDLQAETKSALLIDAALENRSEGLPR